MWLAGIVPPEMCRATSGITLLRDVSTEDIAAVEEEEEVAVAV